MSLLNYPHHPYSIRNYRHSLNKRYVKHKQILQGEPIIQDQNDLNARLLSLLSAEGKTALC